MNSNRSIRSLVAALCAVLAGMVMTDTVSAQSCANELLVSHDILVPAGSASHPGTVEIPLALPPLEGCAIEIKLNAPFRIGTAEGGYVDHRDLKLPWSANVAEPQPGLFTVRITSLAPFAYAGVTVIVRQICS